MNILDKILETKRAEMAAARSSVNFSGILAQAEAVGRRTNSFSEALAVSPTGIIAEFKRRSPSKGFINEGADAATIVKGYSDNGAAAISVLTDRDYFAGSLDDLRKARAVSAVPLLRKDFIIDPYQICEARIAGADVILLIAAALDREQCCDLADFAQTLGLEVLLEIHNESELEYINGSVDVVGINNRDLTSFATDVNVSKRLGGMLPGEMIRISESGISSAETVLELRKAGFRGFLMGENFMKTGNPAETLGDFIKELQ